MPILVIPWVVIQELDSLKVTCVIIFLFLLNTKNSGIFNANI